MLGGVDQPTEGKVWIQGEDIYTLSTEKLAIFRRRQIGLIYQFFNLIPTLNVEENITLPCELDGQTVDKKNSDEIVELLRRANQEYRQTIIMITHNLEIAKTADRVIVIEDGKIIREG